MFASLERRRNSFLNKTKKKKETNNNPQTLIIQNPLKIEEFKNCIEVDFRSLDKKFKLNVYCYNSINIKNILMSNNHLSFSLKN